MHGENVSEFQRYPVNSETDALVCREESQQKKDIQRAYRRHRVANRLMAAAASLGLSVGAYWSVDVLPARAAIENTESSVEFVGDAINDLDKENLTIVSGGTSTLDSTNLALSMPFSAIGQIAAFHYDQNGYDCRDAGEKKAAFIIGQKVVKNVFEYAHSAGGPMNLCALPYIRDELEEYNQAMEQNNPSWQPIRYISLVMDRSPESQLSIQPEARKQAERLREAMSVVPGADVSRTTRYIAEMGARREQFAPNYIPNFSDMTRVSKNVIREKFSANAPTAKLIQAQVEAINQYKTERDMKKVAKEQETQPQVMIGFLSTRENADPIVNGPRARKNWAASVFKNNLRWFWKELPSTVGHDTSMQQPESISRVLRSGVFPRLRSRMREIDVMTQRQHSELLAQVEVDDQRQGLVPK